MESAVGVSAPYGHACAGCSKAKSKCMTRVDGPCERCQRLGKECAPAPLVRKRRPKKPNATVRRSQLEDKLSDLVSLLQAQHQPSVNRLDQVASAPGPEALLPPRMLQTAREIYPTDWNYQSLTPITMASTSAAEVSPVSNDGAHTSTALQIKAEQNLRMFKTHHLERFPLLYLPPETTIEEIQHQRPFLWLNIEAVCEQLPSKQTELGFRIRNILATKVVAEGERSIDLLLGLLVFSSWSFYFARGKPFLGMSSSIAKSLIIDLRLDILADDKASTDGLAASFNCKKPWSFMEPCESTNFRTNEERRILLANYVLTVSLSIITGHDTMRWGPQMDEAIKTLSEEAEWPGDDVLVAMTRLSRISDDAAILIRYGPNDVERAGPALIHIKFLRESLNQVKSSLSTTLLQNKIIASYLYNAEVMIHEIALFQLPLISSHQPYDSRRFEYLYTCAQATKSGLDNFLSLSSSDWIGLNFAIVLQFSHGIQVMHRLSCLQNPGWDRALIRSTIDVLDYLEQAAVKMEQAYVNWRMGRTEEETSVFCKGAQIMRSAVPIWAASLEKADKGDDRQGNENAESGMEEMLMDFSDETWFTDLFGSWNV